MPIQSLDCEFLEEHALLLAKFCVEWRIIGYHLKLTKANITAINKDNDSTEEKRIAMLQTWKEIFAFEATYRVLIEALIRSKNTQQALNICHSLKQYVPQLQATSCLESAADTNCSEQYMDTKQSFKKLQMKFISIKKRFFYPDTGKGPTLEELQQNISLLESPSFTADHDSSEPLELLEATSLITFTHRLKSYCSALNPDILEVLIELLGDDETKTMMKEYIRDLDEFKRKTKLKDFVGNYGHEVPMHSESKEMQLKLGDSWREKTLADLMLIKSQISQQCLVMKTVSTGCICVTFMCPKMDDLELGIHIRDYLQSQCVLQIVVAGVCIFNCEGIVPQCNMPKLSRTPINYHDIIIIFSLGSILAVM